MKADDGTGVMGEYLMLAHELPEDRDLREQLQRERLVSRVQSPYHSHHFKFPSCFTESSSEAAAE